jgi:formate hydrogenlyase subunit 3/multisubunit Na+/H+ antiporter MnhD subunit
LNAESTLLALLVLPLLAAVLSLLVGRRWLGWLGMLVALLLVVLAVRFALQVAAGGAVAVAIGGWAPPLGIALRADGLSAFMLLVQSVVGLGVHAYALAYFAPARRAFWAAGWLLWGACHALYLSGDVFNLYVTLELVGLGAVALVVLGGSGTVAAALRYLLLALVGSMLYLLGVVVLYLEHGNLDLQALGTLVQPGLASSVAAATMTLGLLLKAAVFPLHVWLPPAHAAAPAPVSALLSALVVKAALYLVVRLWTGLFGELPAAGVALSLLAGLGAAALFWGGVQALLQTRLKPMIAYSTVAQIGLLALVLPLLQGGAVAWNGLMLLVAAHALAKSALFLCAGVVQRQYGHDRIAGLGGVGMQLPLTATAYFVAAVSLVGLPPTMGFFGKYLLLEAAIAQSRPMIAAALVLGSLLTAAYLLRPLALGFTEAATRQAPRTAGLGLQLPGLLLALAALLALLVGAGTPLWRLLAVGMPA